MKKIISHYKFIALPVMLLICSSSFLLAQVSLPDRNPLKLMVRAGAMSNNGDLAAELKMKTDGELGYTVNFDYAAIGEAELSIDLLHFRGAGLGLQFSGMFSRPELKATDPFGNKQRIGLTQVEIARATISFSFNGTDPYTMFELPYHSNKEAVLGVTGMIIRTQNTTINSYAMDTLGISEIRGDFSQALGVNFGWNWRLGQSGWVIGLSGQVMFVINKSHILDITTEENGPYSSGKLDFAPRILTAGFGYHF